MSFQMKINQIKRFQNSFQFLQSHIQNKLQILMIQSFQILKYQKKFLRFFFKKMNFKIIQKKYLIILYQLYTNFDKQILIKMSKQKVQINILKNKKVSNTKTKDQKQVMLQKQETLKKKILYFHICNKKIQKNKPPIYSQNISYTKNTQENLIQRNPKNWKIQQVGTQIKQQQKASNYKSKKTNNKTRRNLFFKVKINKQKTYINKIWKSQKIQLIQLQIISQKTRKIFLYKSVLYAKQSNQT
ncbi:hypothetical protein IMG5_189590 [Ichthyophthirius multifiliis]|uniref:Uncharacterized protein n=1 Tax=Ichthyophthirius multifiliis TaxID=5932 RepID=G0R438_ICHMU|nr:hypothetical protein IMG5_189590 [Ichthyophthirius multifiliis]EGR27758.1 hypothetical protein IMG5_189590 [Ichthyophthirius multifiliis]|eukprot:XP_004025210.1 hypothetical protein IMG5_189590 [Ichthyophthirius multifiliis]